MTLVKVNNPVARSFDGLFNELFNEFPATFGKTMREDVLGFPPVNIFEKDNHYHLELSVPGMDKSDFTVNLEGKTLTVSGSKKEEKQEGTEKLIRREFSHKSFKRSFTVDDKIDASGILAKYENGILMLDLPKKEEAKNASRQISIQ
ncbi:MAG: Hsp20/alpha crystallin family protein [Chitinophagaceae bacterium]|nr:Hsp20/alpha crystallin family protein [Chitinophagaceae bacterium]MBL0056679.1 Hsp20/alpha crystallin family protein [Chitinophagaceae bacterium]